MRSWIGKQSVVTLMLYGYLIFVAVNVPVRMSLYKDSFGRSLAVAAAVGIIAVPLVTWVVAQSRRSQ